MDRVQKTINTDLQSVSPKMMIVQGVVQNLPEILGAIKEIYRINKKGEAFSQVLRSQLDELNISKENFNVLVISLTELSKTENADEDTKTMYRDMIKTLFEIFTNNMRSSQDVSSYLNEFLNVWDKFGRGRKNIMCDRCRKCFVQQKRYGSFNIPRNHKVFWSTGY